MSDPGTKVYLVPLDETPGAITMHWVCDDKVMRLTWVNGEWISLTSVTLPVLS